jgi:hypothetical protein
LVVDEFLPDQERLGNAGRLGLKGVADMDSPLRTVAEELLELRLIVRGSDNQDVAYPGQHERGDGVVDHRFVIDRHQLLANRQGQRVQPRPGTTREYDSFPADLRHAALLNIRWSEL